MTADQYVESVLAKYEVARGPTSPAERLGAVVASPVRTWAGQQLNALQYSGSCAKETGVHGVSDVDVFISLKSDTTNTLKEIYDSLYSLAQQQGWSPRQQNVSVGVTVNGTRGDLVPGKVQAGYQNYHSLYLRKRDSWTQTNVSLHVDTVHNSGRLREIRAVKIWRMLHGLDFPSLYLELFVIDALSGRSRTSLADNVLHALRAIGSSLLSTRVMDPANTNNVLSDDLTKPEKERIASLAAQSARQQYWKDIIW
ncbi:nucleotidyltransferase [Accumulibacter sp.]|uniref:nucleotidyltransferase n=1 Tax=Accumulibacter sp. TaxID=2053492 RepID=UPI0025E6CD38|nr:nucleotidyltransferase [Accumulibacter sp.]MCM8594663.1 nucleotidyltransferase [Accumulibacter sp.]MCM8625921.1 nucleotidyltransferase [Accumulibacter sp.]MDS4048809.1 nucleotidyltransferase [Accumulibacter sp.]